MKIEAQTCKPIITELGSINVCVAGSSTTLNVTNPSVTSYLWSTGATVSPIAVTVPGIYTVTAAFSNGCTGSTTIKVEAAEYHVEVDQFISTCFDGSQLITITNPEPGVTYNWAIGGGAAIAAITPSSGASATISYFNSTAQNNYYTITYTFGNCDQIDTFYLMPCCDVVWDVKTDFENVLSSNLNPSYFQSSGLVRFYGTIIIDNFFDFLDCPNIQLAPGALIRIVSGGHLTIRDSYLSGACGRMWRGIEVEGGGELRIAGSTLKDAEISVDLEDKSLIEITHGLNYPNSLFENNYIDIRAVGDFNINTGINDAMFDCTLPFLNPYPGQKLIPTNKPFAAFVLKNSGITAIPTIFGTGGTSSIQINNHACGFYATNYSFNIFNTFFNNIENGTNYGGFGASQNGWAVYAKTTSEVYRNNCSVFIQGLGKSSTPLTFNNCKGGVYTKAMSATVVDCNMLCTQQGINNRLSHSPSAMSYLRNTINVIGISTSPYSTTVDLNGIYSQFSGTSVGGFAGNDINVNAPIAFNQIGQKSACINMDDVLGADNSSLVITANTSRMFNQTRYGMKFNNITSTQIDANFTYCNQGTLSIDNNDLHYCYFSKNSIGLSFTNNFANNVNTAFKVNAVGYYNDMSTRWIYGCNFAYQIGTGFQFDRDCSSPENFRGNFMENNDFGLYINKPTGQIGSQTHRGNEWSLASVLPQPNATVNGGAIASSSQFIVHTAGSSNFNPAVQSLLLFSIQNGSPFSCAGTQLVSPPDTIAIVEDEVQHAESTDETDNGEIGDYILNRNLYSAIDANNEITTSSSIIENYYDSMSLTAIGQLQKVNNSYKNNLSELATISHTWQANDSVMRANALQIMLNNNLLRNGSLSNNDSIALVASNAALQQQTQSLAASNKELANAAKWFHENNAAAALIKNSNVMANSNYAANQKALHQIYARTIALGNDDFTAIEITTLYNIAQQCLSYGGPAVLEARPMYALIDRTVNFEGIPCSLGGNRWGLNDEAESKTDELLVYPNPASDVFNIYIPIEKITEAVVEIYNLTGLRVKSYQIAKPSNTLQIETIDLKQGLYIVKINANNNSIYKSVKVQVIK